MTDALSNLQKHLFVHSGLASYKKKHARGQTTTTCTRGLLDVQDDCINAIVSKYCCAFAAYSALRGSSNILHPLLDAYAHALKEPGNQVSSWSNRMQSSYPLGESHWVLLWIWTSSGAGDEESEMHEGKL